MIPEQVLILSEEHMPLSELALALPRKVDKSTVGKWCSKGLLREDGERVKLGYIKQGRRNRRTSHEAYQRFMERLQE